MYYYIYILEEVLYNMEYGEFLKTKREKLGLSTRGLGKKANISGSYISMIENNKLNNPPSDDVLEELSRALKLTNIEKEILYKLIDDKILPQRIKNKIKKLEKELEQYKNQLSVENNSHIRVGERIKINNSYVDSELYKEIKDLDEKQKEKVLKFINDYIKN